MLSRALDILIETGTKIDSSIAEDYHYSVNTLYRYRRVVLDILLNEWLCDPMVLIKGSDLDICPFCGRIPKLVESAENEYKVECLCGVSSKFFDSRDEAISFWNEGTGKEGDVE